MYITQRDVYKRQGRDAQERNEGTENYGDGLQDAHKAERERLGFLPVSYTHLVPLHAQPGQELHLQFRLWSGLVGGGRPHPNDHKVKLAELAILDEGVDSLYYWPVSYTHLFGKSSTALSSALSEIARSTANGTSASAHACPMLPPSISQAIAPVRSAIACRRSFPPIN